MLAPCERRKDTAHDQRTRPSGSGDCRPGIPLATLPRSAAPGKSWRSSTTTIFRQSALSKKMSSCVRTCAPTSRCPKVPAPHPVVIYLHGGGWAFGSPASFRKLGMQFAEAGYLTIILDYRLAREHPFPAALEDTIFAIGWATDNARRWNGDGRRIAIGGDFAGANLAASALLRALRNCARWCERHCCFTAHTISRRPRKRTRSLPGLQQQLSTYVSGIDRLLDDPRVSPSRLWRRDASAVLHPRRGQRFLVPRRFAGARPSLSAAASPYELHVMEACRTGSCR